jgi:hypothetical protein
MEREICSVNELTLDEQKEIQGGNPVFIFIAGAIVGGMIYDVYKAACKTLLNEQIEHPEYYDGAVHSQR